jgi:hypothetical protein
MLFSKVKKVSLMVLAALALTLAAGSQAQARSRAEEGNRFAVVTLTNQSKDVTVRYIFRWGDNKWQSYTLKPGECRAHYWTFEFVNQNESPVPQVRFYTGINRKRNLQTYKLVAYASPCCKTGKPHNFVRISDDEDYIDLQVADE